MKEENLSQEEIRPLYDSADYHEFCEMHKENGLPKSCWKNLPEMWERELDFRKSFETALAKFVEQGGEIVGLPSGPME